MIMGCYMIVSSNGRRVVISFSFQNDGHPLGMGFSERIQANPAIPSLGPLLFEERIQQRRPWALQVVFPNNMAPPTLITTTDAFS